MEHYNSENNLILKSDSYKYSHWVQTPKGLESNFSYIESRGGRWGTTTFFGLQGFLKKYFTKPITKQDVEYAHKFIVKHGEPFNYEGWMGIVEKHNGYLPLKIRAVPEGSVVSTKNILVSVQETDPQFAWLVAWAETILLRAVWYPTTVATLSWHSKKIIREFLIKTSDNPEGELPFKLHDFGGRGVSSGESAAIGGAAHLVNFQGSDTVEGVEFANNYYNCDMSAFSIPAAEHSTITSWTRAGEIEAYRNMLNEFGKPGKIFAVVSDSYNIFNAVENIWCGALLEEVKDSGATVVIRPDSGNPSEVVLKILRIMERKIGMKKNMKGYKVLPSYFRIIQGDGMNEDSIYDLLYTITGHGYSASNIAMGMGGGLLQHVNRDTLQFAFKCAQVVINGEKVDIFKDPITDQGKKSKRGFLDLIYLNNGYKTVNYDAGKNSALKTVFENGKMVQEYTMEEIRKRADAALENV